MIGYIVCCLILNDVYDEALHKLSFNGDKSYLMQTLNQARRICEDFDTSPSFKYTKYTMFTRLVFAVIVLLLMHFVSYWFHLVYIFLCSTPSIMANSSMRSELKSAKEQYPIMYYDGKYMLKAHTIGMAYTIYLLIAMVVICGVW